MKKLLIVGGGMGGLGTALACARAGAHVDLYERSNAFSEVGAGIQLGPNAVRVLYGWGLKEALDKVVALPHRLQVRSASTGTELGVLRLGEHARQRYGAPYVTIHRADLQELLVQAVSQESRASVHLGQTIATFSQNAQGVTLELADGEHVSGDALVGADGGYSRIRQLLLTDGLPRPTGHLAYRAMVEQDSLPAALRSQQVTAWLGPRLHVVQYPVRAGRWLNVVAIVHGSVQGDMSHWDHSANATDLQRCLAHTCVPLQSLVAAIPRWRLWPLSIRPPMTGAHQHAKGRVALLGDAAHPMVPYLAQGAGMAIEDAAALTQALSAGGFFTDEDEGRAVPEMLQHFAQARWQRNARVQARALRNGEIFHATGVVRWGRDVAMQLLGESLLDMPWLYGHEAARRVDTSPTPPA